MRRAVHLMNANYGAAYNALLVDRDARMLCGKPLFYKTERTDYQGKAIKTRETTYALDRLSEYKRIKAADRGRNKYAARMCKRCAFLGKLTPTEREAELQKEAQVKAERFAKLKDKGAAEKATRDAALAIEFAQARIDAQACLDHYIASGGGLIRRCRHWVGGKPTVGESREWRCNLVLDHAGPCRLAFDNEPEHVDAADVIQKAIELYKKEHKSGGDRLYVLQHGSRRCRSCNWYGDNADGAGPDNPDTCPDCGGNLPDRGRGDLKHVVCRFCRVVLGRNQPAFERYDRSWFHGLAPGQLPLEDGDQAAHEDQGTLCEHGDHQRHKREDGWYCLVANLSIVNVDEHTIHCALEYLVGVTRTEQDDSPMRPSALPVQSFVLDLEAP